MDGKPADAVETEVQSQEPAPAPAAVPGSSIPQEELEQLTADIVAALKTVYDPRDPCRLLRAGLIYKITSTTSATWPVEMTLTSPGAPSPARCPLGGKRGRPVAASAW